MFLEECSVSSNKVFLTLLQSYLFSFLARSAWSRARAPIEIGDISREESLNYLINRHGIKTVKEGKIDTTDAEKLYDLVGGRILDLKSVADEYQQGQSIEGRISFDILHYVVLL